MGVDESARGAAGADVAAQRFDRLNCLTGVRHHPLDAPYSLLLQHYRARLVASQALRPSLRVRLETAGFAAPGGPVLDDLGLVDRALHHLTKDLPAPHVRDLRSAWRALGLLAQNGRETFGGCLILPFRCPEEDVPRLIGLPLRALVDSRGVELRGLPGQLALFASHRLPISSVLTACSDPFDAAVLLSQGGNAMAAFGAVALSVDVDRLAATLRHDRPRLVRIACAATARGRVAREAWLAAAHDAAVCHEIIDLPAGCGIRDLRAVSGPDAITDLLAGRLVAPRVRSAAASRPAPVETPLPWASARTALAQDLTAFVDHLSARGHAKAECRRRALALALFWESCTREGLLTTQDLAQHDVERFQRDLVRQSTADPTCRSRGATIRILSALRGFLTWALRTGRLRRDAAAALIPLRRPAVSPPLVLNDAEIEGALRAIVLKRGAGVRDRAMLEVLYSTGIRRVELVGLDVSDLDPVRQVLRIRQGKGGRSRLVPVGQRAVRWAQHYVESARPRHLRDVGESALFLSRRGRRMGAKAVTARMHSCLRAAGITKPGSCHIIRHSVATLMHDAGADIRDLQALLGHALLTSTQLYTRVSMARLQEVHARTHPAERAV